MYTEHKYIIYEIENQINGKKYVGQTTRGFNKRKKEHIYVLNNNRSSNHHLQRSWNKYGAENFTFNILEECDYDDLDYLETNYIFMWNLMNPIFGYNEESGGNIHKKISDEARKKMSEARKGVYAGKNHPRYGKNHSDEARRKMSLNHADFSGENHPMYGKSFSDKVKKNMSKTKTTTGFYRVYKGIENKCEQGYRWRYGWSEGGKHKSLSSTDLNKLEQKIKAKGLVWEVIDAKKAKKTIEENNRLHPKGD